MPWFQKLYHAFHLSSRLRPIADAIVEALGGVGQYHGLHIRDDNKWCLYMFKNHKCREMEMNCAVTAIRNSPEVGRHKVRS